MEDIKENTSEQGKRSLLCSLAIILVRFYQIALSPHLAGCCRFEPTCSNYALMAFRRYGFLKGLVLTAKRLFRCRPGGPYGYDPVP